MKNVFKIENELISLNHKDIQKSKFVIKSSPYDYTVKFIDDKTLRLVLLQNRNINKKKNFLFVDKKVDKIYKEKLWKKDSTLTLIANEENKTINSALLVIDLLNKNNFTKKEILISIGGGITQDVTAFARAIFKRGINWTYFPTTLLSMADSCIGAKSAINYGGTKNLIGLFSAPKEVFINTTFLKTLDKRDVLSGYGEIIKLCIVGGESTIEEFKKAKDLQNGDLLFQIDILIKTALIVKKAVISEDEFENNIRKALNYGHTVGHAIESIVKFLGLTSVGSSSESYPNFFVLCLIPNTPKVTPSLKVEEFLSFDISLNIWKSNSSLVFSSNFFMSSTNPKEYDIFNLFDSIIKI